MITPLLYKIAITLFYFLISLPIFNQVYETSELVIDEEFHLRQASHFCNGTFTIWDPKITTFPGLYILSAIFLLPFNCSVYNLRLISLIASTLNVFLIFEIRNRFNDDKKHLQFAYTALESLTIALLPPMYFFSHLYYTDILSITFVLAMTLSTLKNKHTISAIFGFFSVLMRQTNIVWICMLFGVTALNKIMSKSLQDARGETNSNKRQPKYGIKDIFIVLGYYLRHFRLIPKMIKSICRDYIGYILVISLFLLFLFFNGSIVIGDKTAHQAAIHIPQLFYFSIFFIIFGISIVLNKLKTIKVILKKRMYLFIAIGIIMGIIIANNTIVHPYLLADNRHYTFYIWNRFYGKFSFGKYLMIPFYIFGLISIWITLTKKSTGFITFYYICLLLSISLQQMIEIRYFIIPFLLLRVTAE